MDTKNTLTLKRVTDFLRVSRPDREPVFYRDWTRIDTEDAEFYRKDEFRCELKWQKVKLYEKPAEEYLHFAEQDTKEDSERGSMNALGNANRAVKCRVDEILKLLNLNPISSRKRWNWGKKMQALEPFGIPNLEILKSLITSRRNKMEHDYLQPERQEAREAVEVVKLLLEATHKYVERGYISSATVAYDSWFKPAVFAAARFGGKLRQRVSGKYGYQDGLRNEYQLAFDLKDEAVTLSFLYKEVYRKCDLKTDKEMARREDIIEKEGPVTIPLRECRVEDIVNLMAQLLEKGRG